MRTCIALLVAALVVTLLAANTAHREPYQSGPFADDVRLDTTQVRVLTVFVMTNEDGSTQLWSKKDD